MDSKQLLQAFERGMISKQEYDILLKNKNAANAPRPSLPEPSPKPAVSKRREPDSTMGEVGEWVIS